MLACVMPEIPSVLCIQNLAIFGILIASLFWCVDDVSYVPPQGAITLNSKHFLALGWMLFTTTVSTSAFYLNKWPIHMGVFAGIVFGLMMCALIYYLEE
jgi:hypothetical protein